MSSVKYISGEGGSDPYVMIVGEAPGAVEEIQGRPFVGKSGTFLREQITEIFKSYTTYFTNVVKVRPDNNRTPTKEEIQSWRSLLWEEIEQKQPNVIITVGLTAAQAVNDDYNISTEQYHLTTRCDIWGTKYNIISTYHPAYVLRSKQEIKDKFINDLKSAKKLLDQINGDKN